MKNIKKNMLYLSFLLISNFLLLSVHATTINLAIGAGVNEINEKYKLTSSSQLGFLWGNSSMMLGFGFIKNATYSDNILGFEALDLMVKLDALTLGFFYGGKTDHFTFSDPLDTDDIYSTSGLFIDYDMNLNKNLSLTMEVIYETPAKGPSKILPSILLKYWWL